MPTETKVTQPSANNINPFTGQTVDPQIAKLTQEDYLASLTQKPLVTSATVQNEVDSTNKIINDIGQKKTDAKANGQVDTVVNNEAKKYQTDYDKESEAVNSYLDSALKTQTDFFDSIYTATTSASDTLIQSLKDIYANRTEEMKTLNKATLGGVTKMGIRSGRNRYAPVIESGILSAEESAGINRIKTLQAEEAKLIAEAQIAKTQNQWKLFSENRDKLTELHEKKLTAIKDQLDFAIKTETLAQSQSENALGKLKEIATLGSTLTPEYAAQVDATYGEGFAQKYYDATKLAKEADTSEKKLDLAQKLVNMLNDIPEGEEFEFNGNTYTGMKTKDPAVQMWLEKDVNGQYQVISVDKNTGVVTTKGTGVVGKQTGDGSDQALIPTQTFEQWLKVKEENSGMSYDVNNLAVKNKLQQEYKDNVKYTVGLGFTDSEKKKLEAAGLTNADRQTQLDYVYGTGDAAITDRYTSAQQTELRSKFGQDWKNKLDNGTLTPEELDKFLSGDSSSRGWQSTS